MILRKVIGVVLGVVIANVFIFGWEWLGHQLPLGAEPAPLVDAASPTMLSNVPFAVKMWVVSGWLVGTFVGALAAFRAARWDFAGWIVAALVAAAGLANVLMIAHPLWMAFSAIALPFIGALFAFGLYRRLRAADLHLSRSR